jgi:glycosyltransferase involved in cell wall biosynthesis
LTKAKNPALLIVTSDISHPTFSRLHLFLPFLREKFDVTIVDLQKYYLMTDKESSSSYLIDFIRFLSGLLKALIGGSQSVNGVYTVTLPRIKGGLLLSFLVAPLLIRKLVKEKNIGAIWGMGPVAGFCVMLSKVKVPFIYDDYDRHQFFYDDPLMKKAMQKIQKFCIVGADVVAAASSPLCDSSRKMRGSKSNVISVPNGVDIRKYPRSNTSEHDLFYMGIIDERHGLHYVLEAMGSVVSSEPDVSLVAVGPIDTAYSDRLQQIIDRFHLHSHVQFKGRVNRDKVLENLSHAKIGVATYPKTELNEYAFTIKLIEYMACGLAIIASDVGDTAEIVRNANCGIVVEPRPKDIAEAIITLMEDHSLRRHYGECGRQYVSQNYNIETISRKLIQLFESLRNTRTKLST